MTEHRESTETREEREERARGEYLREGIQSSLKSPGGYARGTLWAMGPVGIHRDSDPLERSNYRVALREMARAIGKSPDDIPTMPHDASLDPVETLALGRFGHWAVGWIEEILYRANCEELARTAWDIAQRLESYPVLDEEDYSAEEWEENHPRGYRYCYAPEEEDCNCGRVSIYAIEEEGEGA